MQYIEVNPRGEGNEMLITAITTWEGTPTALEGLAAGSQAAAPIHEGFGAKNPRLMRSASGGDMHRCEYMIDFDSFEAYGRFVDAMNESSWWSETTAAVAAAYPALKNCGTRLVYNVI